MTEFAGASGVVLGGLGSTAGTSAAAATKTRVPVDDVGGQKVELVPPASRGWGAWSQGQRDVVVAVAVVAGLGLMAVVAWVFWRGRERRKRAQERQKGWVPSDDDERSFRSGTTTPKKLESLKIFKRSPAKGKDSGETERTIEGLESIELGPAARRAFWEDLTMAGDIKKWESGIAMHELGGRDATECKPTMKQKRVRIDGVTVIDGSHERDERGIRLGINVGTRVWGGSCVIINILDVRFCFGSC